MEITLITTFDLSQDITLDAYCEGKRIGTAVIKDETITYYNLTDKKTETYTEENLSDFVQFVEDNDLRFLRVSDHKWSKYNPNPQNHDTGDCSIRAYCAAEDLTWDEAYDLATSFGKEMAMICDDHKVINKILTEHFGYEYFKGEKGDKKKTVNEFAIEHPTGKYILRVRNHVVTLIDGYYYDSWDSGTRKVNGYYTK